MTELVVMGAMQVAIAASSGIVEDRVFLDRRSTPRLNVDHVRIQRITSRGLGRAYQVDDEWHQHRRLRLQVTGLGSDSSDRLLSTHILLASRSPVHAALRSVGIGITEMTAMRDLTRVGAQGWERVSSFDVTLSYVHVLTAETPATADRIRVLLEAHGALTLEPTEVYDDQADTSTQGALAVLFPATFVAPF